MSLTTVIRDIVDNKMKYLHVAFLAQVLSISDNKAKIQPLGLIREADGTTTKQAPISNVHIARSARFKIFDDNGTAGLISIKKGDIVLCVCCDRNIDAALKGENAVLPAGCHTQSDCVIVSVI